LAQGLQAAGVKGVVCPEFGQVVELD